MVQANFAEVNFTFYLFSSHTIECSVKDAGTVEQGMGQGKAEEASDFRFLNFIPFQ